MHEAAEHDMQEMLVDDHPSGQLYWTQQLDTDVDDTVGHAWLVLCVDQRSRNIRIMLHKRPCKLLLIPIHDKTDRIQSIKFYCQKI